MIHPEPRSNTRVTRPWGLFMAVVMALCALYFVITGHTLFGSTTDTVVTLIGLGAFLLFAWDQYAGIARRHEEDRGFRKNLNRIEAYSVRPDAAAGEAGIERLEQEIREESGIPAGRSITDAADSSRTDQA